MNVYIQEFYRFNSYTKPILKQTSSVIFQSGKGVDSEEFGNDMWGAMWDQNPSWLLSHGPSILGFHGWSSVMTEGPLIKKVEIIFPSPPTDLTGESVLDGEVTFHPWCPDDLRQVLKSAFRRGQADAS